MGKRKGARDNVWHAREFILENPALMEYYVEQGVVRKEEMEAFAAAMRKPLGAALRLNPANPGLPELVRHLREDFQFAGQRITLETGEEFEPPRSISWVPDHCGWRLNVARKDLRKSTQLAKFFNWVKRHNAMGNLTRQEEVSMIPPLLLDVQPHHRVLDLCAAPGSKTTQIAELLHASSRDTPSGVLVANDVDKKRALVLSHQQRRLGSPAVVVTQHPAQHFPALQLQSREDMAREMGVAVEELPPSPLPESAGAQASEEGFFDRVLCDVPCSGDGTIRKNPMIWRTWSPADGLNLHPLQLSIAKRGARLLKVGGVMVYSTCSLNPIEDEAVVAALLREGRGALELVDCSHRLPSLHRAAGLSTWRVPDAPRTMLYGRAMPDRRKRRRGAAEGGEEETAAPPPMETQEEVDAVPYESRFKWYRRADEVSEERRRELNLRASAFPPSPEEAPELHLDRCMRLLPHAQDTGGFFVAVLRKTGPITPAARRAEHREKEMKEEEEKEKKGGVEEVEEEGASETGGSGVAAGRAGGEKVVPQQQQRKQKQKNSRGDDDHLRPLPASLRRHVTDSYGMSPAFPWHLLFCRSDSPRMVTLVSETAARACILGEAAAKLRVVYTGVKCFERAGKAGSDTAPRMLQEAAVMLGGAATQRVLRLSLGAYLSLLSRPRDPLSLDQLEGEVAALAAALGQGPVIAAPASAASEDDPGAALSEEEANKVPAFARIAREAPNSLLLSCFLGARTLNNAAGIGHSRKILNALAGDDIDRIHAEEEATRARNREKSEAGARDARDAAAEPRPADAGTATES